VAAKVPFSTTALAPEYRRPSIEEFYESYYPYTLTSVLNSGVNPGDAEDVVQEIFIKFLYHPTPTSYYEQYDYRTRVTFKNFYRHVMKLYLRGMAETHHLKSKRLDLLDTTDPMDSVFEQPEQMEFEFIETIRLQASRLTDVEAAVLMATANMVLDRETRFPVKEIGKRAGVTPTVAKHSLMSITTLF
jgi:DNA-directed RNA polymerase specialized sigma24 family protein